MNNWFDPLRSPQFVCLHRVGRPHLALMLQLLVDCQQLLQHIKVVVAGGGNGRVEIGQEEEGEDEVGHCLMGVSEVRAQGWRKDWILGSGRVLFFGRFWGPEE